MHFLIINHKDSAQHYGGPTYKKSIISLIASAFPNSLFDELFFEQRNAPPRGLLHKGFSFFLSLFSALPAKAYHFYSASFRKTIERHLKNKSYDGVIINGIDILWSINSIPSHIPKIYIAHNIEHQLQAQQVDHLPKIPITSSLLQRDLKKLRTYELSGICKADKVVAISQSELDYFQQSCPGPSYITILPTFAYPPVRKIPYNETKPIKLGFLGNLGWWPNRQSIQWFFEKIWPDISKGPYEFHIFGKNSDTLPAAQNIFRHGYTEDIMKLWNTIDIMLQPITVGGGINIKVAETLYNRLPVIATPLALRGLPLTSDPGVVILASPSDWIAYFNEGHCQTLATQRISHFNATLFSRKHNVQIIKDFFL